jgi:hypothetical protein
METPCCRAARSLPPTRDRQTCLPPPVRSQGPNAKLFDGWSQTAQRFFTVFRAPPPCPRGGGRGVSMKFRYLQSFAGRKREAVSALDPRRMSEAMARDWDVFAASVGSHAGPASGSKSEVCRSRLFAVRIAADTLQRSGGLPGKRRVVPICFACRGRGCASFESWAKGTTA